MERIDALGYRPDRHDAFGGAMLADTDDGELQQIVEQAARELDSPMATVTLVLDQIQLFRAHWGLPPSLVASRGTHRDASFCQFVVRDGEAFEVRDAPNDPRVPQELVKAYGLRAYLGVPIHARDTVVGSLCVLDTRERSFSEADRESLVALAARADERLLALCENRRSVRLVLAEQASQPGLAELQESLAPIPDLAGSAFPALAAIRSFLRLSAHALEDDGVPAASLRSGLEAALAALEQSENALYDIDAAAADCEDCVRALEHLTTPTPATRLSEVVTAAQDLARRSTRAVGGAPLPDLDFDPWVQASRPMAVALVTTSLTSVAEQLDDSDERSGIRMRVRDLGGTAELVLSADGLSDAAAEGIAERLNAHIGEYPTVAIHPLGGAVRLAFRVVEAALDPS